MEKRQKKSNPFMNLSHLFLSLLLAPEVLKKSKPSIAGRLC